MNTINRLQFRHHGIGSGYTVAEGVFETRDEAIDYIKTSVKYAEEGLASVDVSYGLSLFGEPTVLRYKNEENESDPHLILAIGSVTNEDEAKRHSKNRFCIIDTHKTESDIDNLQEQIDELSELVKIIAKSTDTLDLYAEQTESGTVISGDVRVAEYHVFDRIAEDNNIMKTDDGLFMFVDVEYDENSSVLNFTVNDVTKTFKVTGNDVVSGVYKPQDESLHIRTRFGDEISINLEDLLAEWVVEGEATKSPIVLTRKEVGYDDEVDHHHVEPWQDILSADVRIADERVNNILKKTIDNRYLYVDGEATNIVYYSSTGKTNVQDALDGLSKMRVSTDSNNIITTKADGFFASSKLEYISSENTLVFTTSSNDEEERKKETRIALNSFQLFDEIYYESSTESLVILYTDGNGKQQRVKIPIGEMMQEWEWEPQNDGHNVYIDRARIVHGNDKVSADVKLFRSDDNILVDNQHMLYVRGTADNIKYGRNSNVESEIDYLKESDAETNSRLNSLDNSIETLTNGLAEEITRATSEESRIDAKLDAEIEHSTSKDRELETKIDDEVSRAIAKDNELDGKIGTGFTNDPHDNVTYKFEQLQNKVDTDSTKLDDEIARSTAKDTEHDGKIEAIEEEIGDGFGARNTVRDEINRLQGEIDAVSGDSAGSIKDIINTDESINVDKTDATKPVISVNLSNEVEDGRKNIIKLNADGLYANVDLSYDSAANKLLLHTSGENPDKEIQLESMSSIISIEYNSSKEAVVITYLTNGHEIKVVEIPVGDLINEWRVWDGHEGAVQLTKDRIASGTTDKDVLKAAVVISDTHSDNILVNDNGALYVPGKGITDNAAAIDALEERMDSAEDEIESTIRTLNNEITRAIGAERELEEDLSDEISRATAKDGELETKINNEVTRSTNKDNELEAAINNEVVRATSAETALQTAISNEVSRATNAEAGLRAASEVIANDLSALSNSVESEIDRLDDKDAELEGRINDVEGECLINFDDTNTISIIKSDASNGYIVKANVNIDGSEGNNIEERANGIYSTVDLTYDETTNKLTFTNTSGSKVISLVSNSVVDKIYYDAQNESIVIEYTVNGQRMPDVVVPVRDLINEIDVASTSTVELIKTPNTSTGSDIITANVKLNTYHTDNILTDDGGLYVSGAQIEANKDAIEDLDERLDEEVVRAANAEDEIMASVNEASSAIATETVRATSAETVINAAISSEADRASREEARIEAKVDAEVNRASAKDTEIDTKIDNEVSRATTKDTELTNAINSEVVRASSAETALQTAITNETSRATAAESALSDRIDEVDAKTFTLAVEDTTTLDLNLDANNKLSGNIVIANGNSNIIKATSNTAEGSGLYASVDLEYDAATNKLKLITSAVEKEVALSIGSILKSIEYDPVGRNLIIKYDVNTAGSIHEETIFVPVEDLFNDWTVQEGQHLGAIILHKEEGMSGQPDVLSAEIVLSTLEDNMLVNDQGSLYVSKAPINQLSGEVADLRDDFEASLEVEDTNTLHLERDRSNTLKGDVKLDSTVEGLNLLRETDNGLMFNGNIDCGEYI